jgi:hypothetical protein
MTEVVHSDGLLCLMSLKSGGFFYCLGLFSEMYTCRGPQTDVPGPARGLSTRPRELPYEEGTSVAGGSAA